MEELIREKEEALKLWKSTLMQGQPIPAQTKLLSDDYENFLERLKDQLEKKEYDRDMFREKYFELLNEYLLTLGKVGPRPVIDSYENSFSKSSVYGSGNFQSDSSRFLFLESNLINRHVQG
jgi:hypothetical protein